MSTVERMNITLPSETAELLNKLAPKGQRSRFIADAIEYYAGEKAREQLRQGMKEEALAYADLSRELAEEWFSEELV